MSMSICPEYSITGPLQTNFRHLRGKAMIVKFYTGLLLVAAAALPVARAQTAQTAAQQLANLTAELGKLPASDHQIQGVAREPADFALREQIVKLAVSLDPPPAIPKEANRHFVRAGVFLQYAQSPSDYNTVINEYGQALLLAPWWGNAYYNLSVAEEKAGLFDDATANLRLYLLTHPAAADAQAAQDKIYAIGVEKELAAKRNAAAQAAANQQRQENDWKQLSAALAAENVQAALDGPWVVSGGNCAGATVELTSGTLSGSLTFNGSYTDSNPLGSSTHKQTVTPQINGSIALGVISGQADFPSTSMAACTTPPNEQTLSGTLSADGRSMTLQTTYVIYGSQTKGMSIFQTCVSVNQASSQTVQCKLVSRAAQPLPLLQVARGLPPGSPQISQTDAATLVLSHGGDVNAVDNLGRTALHIAAGQGNSDFASFLLENGARVGAPDNNNNTPLSYAIDSKSLNTVQLLLAHGAQPDGPPDQNGMTPLERAVFGGDAAIVEELLQNTRDPNAVNGALYFLTDANLDVANLLLTQGVDVNTNIMYDSTPLTVATLRGCGAVNAEILNEDPRGEKRTPCFPQGVTQTISLLIAHGATVDARDASGATPLMRAAETGNLDVVKLLIAHGGNINAKDLKGHSALQYAKDGWNKENRKAVIRFLESQGLKK